MLPALSALPMLHLMSTPSANIDSPISQNELSKENLINLNSSPGQNINGLMATLNITWINWFVIWCHVTVSSNCIVKSYSIALHARSQMTIHNKLLTATRKNGCYLHACAYQSPCSHAFSSSTQTLRKSFWNKWPTIVYMLFKCATHTHKRLAQYTYWNLFETNGLPY